MSLLVTQLAGFGGYTEATVLGPTTWDSAKKSSNITLFASDLECYSGGGAGFNTVLANNGRSSGKYYFELKMTGLTPGEENYFVGGLATTTGSYTGTYPGNYASSCGAQGNGTIYGNGFTDGGMGGITPTLNDKWCFAVDLDAGKVFLAQNNAYGSQNPATGANPWKTFTPPLTLYPACALYINDTANSMKLQVGANLTYSPPSGYTSW